MPYTLHLQVSSPRQYDNHDYANFITLDTRPSRSSMFTYEHGCINLLGSVNRMQNLGLKAVHFSFFLLFQNKAVADTWHRLDAQPTIAYATHSIWYTTSKKLQRRQTNTIIVKRYTVCQLERLQPPIKLVLSPVDHSFWKGFWRMAAEGEWCSNIGLVNHRIPRRRKMIQNYHQHLTKWRIIKVHYFKIITVIYKKPALTTASWSMLAMFLCLNSLIFDHKTNGFPGAMVEHYCVKFGDPSCIGF